MWGSAFCSHGWLLAFWWAQYNEPVQEGNLLLRNEQVYMYHKWLNSNALGRCSVGSYLSWHQTIWSQSPQLVVTPVEGITPLEPAMLNDSWHDLIQWWITLWLKRYNDIWAHHPSRWDFWDNKIFLHERWSPMFIFGRWKTGYFWSLIHSSFSYWIHRSTSI